MQRHLREQCQAHLVQVPPQFGEAGTRILVEKLKVTLSKTAFWTLVLPF